AQIRSLTAEEAARRYPVHVRAVVTYFDPDPDPEDGPDPDLFIQDSSAGIWVELGRGTRVSLRPGQTVEVEGVSSAPDFAPQISHPRITVVGEGRLPVARAVSFQRMASGAEDSQWVETDGIVHSAVRHREHLTLSLAVDGGRVVVRVPAFRDAVPAGLVDSQVRLRGACATIFNQKNRLTGVLLLVPSLAQLRVEGRAPGDPFALPLQPAKSLLTFTPKGASGHRVRVEGVVTFNPTGPALFIKDGGQGLRIETGQATTVRPGDRVDVAGFPAPGDYSPVLEDSVLRKLGPGAEPEAVRVNGDQVMNGTYDADLVRIEGRLRDQVRRRGVNDLVLESGELIFDAEIADRDTTAGLPPLTNGSRLDLTGVCSIRAGQDRVPVAFRLLLRSSRDIVVLERPPWWTVRRAAWALGIMGLAILAATEWVLVLRRRVADQTGIILRRLQHEVALEDRYRDLFENATDIVYTHDLQGRITSLNRAGEGVTGYSREKAIGLNIDELAAPEYRDKMQEMIQRKLLTGETTIYEVEALTPGGLRVPLEVSTRLISRDGKPFEIQGNARDITERKRVEAEMKWAKDAAEAANRAKSEFLANISHEIRTPLNGILGMTELALETRLEPDQREYLEIVRSSADSLLRVLNDVLDFAKIEARKLEFETIPFGLREAVKGALKLPAKWARDKGLGFECHVSPRAPETLTGDPARLGQVVLNLAANAVKFTERGGIDVAVEADELTDDRVRLEFRVTDTGIGIPANKQQVIFEAFAQADGSTTRKYGGSGLGLAISMELVQLMGGRMWVESEPGVGSSFHFTACFGVDRAALPERPELTPRAGLLEVPMSAEGDSATTRRWPQELRRRSGARALENPPVGPDRPDPPRRDDAVLDRAAALARVEGDGVLLGELAALFIEDCPRILAAIRDAIARQDADALSRAAHALKGSAANFSASRAVDDALRLETMGRRGDLEGAQEACDALEATLDRLTKVLAGLAKEAAR
ncbi:MAG TPA: ATP-binding protein, partial [Terriglobia bacterium]|nr:ATP-binding protein [Terriglobia bacterium]